MRRLSASIWVFLASITLASCGSGVDRIFLPNQAPVVSITRTALETSGGAGNSYRVTWQGRDFDGRVDHYLYAINPPSVDRAGPAWLATRSTTWSLTAPPFSGARPAPSVFAVRAVDEHGAVSDAAWFSYSADNIPPSVLIQQPRPSSSFVALVPPSVRIHWTGIDPDGQTTSRPVKYKYRLFVAQNPDFPAIPDFLTFALQNPDSLRKLYAPGFAGWDSTSGDSTATSFTNLIPNVDYLFVLTGFDEVGDYDPVFSANKNMLRIRVVHPCTVGPRLCFTGQNFNYCYDSASCESDPSRYVKVEMPSDEPIRIQWSGIPMEGSEIRAYRWVLDPADLQDETPRSDEESDWYHWSAWSSNNTEAVIGPFLTYETKRHSHLLYVEVEDINGLRSLGIVNLIVVPATFTEELLFVNDTRRTLDQVDGGVLRPPVGPWPTAAELDTFLFARGGFPWKGYPEGTSSPPGVFNGYRFDTLGTRRLTSGIVPLSTLASYRTVVWMVDDVGAAYTGGPTDPLQPMTVLRRIASPGQANVLATYMAQGGRLWLMGGGAAYATLIPWNRANTSPTEFTNADGELVPGRFMYDFAHWRSAISVHPAQLALLNIPEFLPPYPNSTPGRGWTGHGVDRNLSMPDYGKLEAGAPYLSARTCSSDPPSPFRDCGSFYLNDTYIAEFLGSQGSSSPNLIREDADPDPGIVDEQSTLDTLYFTAGGTVPYGRPVMTYYHGFESPQLVFSGFPLWHFQRSQVTQLAEFVLSDIFQLFRTPQPQPAAVQGGAPGALTARSRHETPLKKP